ncbi:hypothetical protein C8R42DRAFT_660855 [Lentinula raphanica]|nr:hypothetical protein C8R42DRAFT_660855 [Lentinula raphanica]
MMEDYQNDDDQDKDDMQTDDYNDDSKISAGFKQKLYKVDYKLLCQNSVENTMKEDLDRIYGIFGVEPVPTFQVPKI